jgi:hypothetical protein
MKQPGGKRREIFGCGYTCDLDFFSSAVSAFLFATHAATFTVSALVMGLYSIIGPSGSVSLGISFAFARRALCAVFSCCKFNFFRSINQLQ